MWRNPRQVPQVFFAALTAEALLRWPVWQSVVRLSAAGEGVFTVADQSPQAVFSRFFDFFAETFFGCFSQLVRSLSDRSPSSDDLPLY